jgi:hypothetical protein
LYPVGTNVISSPVRAFLALLIVFALTFSNGVGQAAALCHHKDGRAHAAALKSPDRAIAVTAATEDTAAASIGKDGALANAAAVSVTSFILPADAIRFPVRVRSPAKAFFGDGPSLASRSLRPLLEPPLA